jgi:hypothetical protein
MAENSCEILADLVDRSTNVADNESQRNPLFMYLGKFI